jgi:SAM-dependent methyltransferase
VTRGSGLLEGFLARQRSRQARTLIPPSSGNGRVLDIGCGSYPLFLVGSEFAEKFGLDRVPVSLPDELRSANLKIVKHDVHTGAQLPFPADCFDVVTMLAVFEHLEPTVLSRLLAEIRRILKPGGIYVMTTPAHWTDWLLKVLARLRLVSHEEIDEHQDSYRHPAIRSYLEGAGFASERIRTGYFEAGVNTWATAAK